MSVPSELRYTPDHEWVRLEDDLVRVGITDFAQEALGDIVFVELPPVGTVVDAEATLGEVESTKSVSELYAPVAGEVVEVNDALTNAPERLNADPYGAGWICVLKPSDSGQLAGLLDAVAYEELTAADAS